MVKEGDKNAIREYIGCFHGLKELQKALVKDLSTEQPTVFLEVDQLSRIIEHVNDLFGKANIQYTYINKLGTYLSLFHSTELRPVFNLYPLHELMYSPQMHLTESLDELRQERKQGAYLTPQEFLVPELKPQDIIRYFVFRGYALWAARAYGTFHHVEEEHRNVFVIEHALFEAAMVGGKEDKELRVYAQWLVQHHLIDLSEGFSSAILSDFYKNIIDETDVTVF